VETDAQSPAPAATIGELLAELDALLLELQERLDAYVESGGDDVVAADEGFRIAGLVQASTESAARHAGEVATRLERTHSATHRP
jgi:hypothetical protein